MTLILLITIENDSLNLLVKSPKLFDSSQLVLTRKDQVYDDGDGENDFETVDLRKDHVFRRTIGIFQMGQYDRGNFWNWQNDRNYLGMDVRSRNGYVFSHCLSSLLRHIDRRLLSFLG